MYTIFFFYKHKLKFDLYLFYTVVILLLLLWLLLLLFKNKFMKYIYISSRVFSWLNFPNIYKIHYPILNVPNILIIDVKYKIIVL